MKLPNNDKTKVPTGHVLSSNKDFSVRIELLVIELLTKGVQRESTNNPGCCLDTKLLTANEKQDPMAKDNTYITHLPWRCHAAAYIEPEHLHFSIFKLESVLCATK